MKQLSKESILSIVIGGMLLTIIFLMECNNSSDFKTSDPGGMNKSVPTEVIGLL